MNQSQMVTLPTPSGDPGGSPVVYITPFLRAVGTWIQWKSGTETARQTPMPRCVVVGLRIVTSSLQPSGGTWDFAVRKNGANTPVIVSVPAHGAAGIYEDLVDGEFFAVGDFCSISALNNDPNPSASLQSVELIYALLEPVS